MQYIFAVLLSALVSTARFEPVAHENDLTMKSESDLRRDLFQNYDNLVRPIKNPKDTITVDVSLSPIQIKEVDEKNRALVLDSWIKMKWSDDNFVWDPKDYSNITVLRIPSSEIWKPDVAVYTATPDIKLFPTSPTRAMIYPNKNVLWVPYFTLKSRCPVQKSDRNVFQCNIKLGSWTYDGLHIDVQLGKDQGNLKDFSDIHPDWKMADYTYSREDTYYDCCPEPYPVLHFNFTLQRRNPFRKSTKNEVWPELN